MERFEARAIYRRVKELERENRLLRDELDRERHRSLSAHRWWSSLFRWMGV